MVCGADDAVIVAVFYGLKCAFAKAIKVGSDWYVDKKVAESLETLYSTTKADRRRRPWPTVRRLIDAYKTGDKTKFETLKQALRDCKDEMTEEYREALAEGLAQESLQSMVEVIDMLAEMLKMID
mmetsp:Transcript_33979/g.76387  ORF Transcript_33979/g.76387 Transcript_33979/m.76387 type:complete len:125 (-) Transcript_33979:2439-2813(-)